MGTVLRAVVGLVVVLFTNVYVKTGMVTLIGQLDTRFFAGRLEALAGTPGEVVDATGKRVPNHKRWAAQPCLPTDGPSHRHTPQLSFSLSTKPNPSLQPESQTNPCSRYYVEIPTKLVNYVCLSLMTVWGVPLLWRYLGII